MQKKYILSFIIIIILVIIGSLFIAYDNKKSSYINLNSSEVNELWIQYEQFLNQFAYNIDIISQKNFDDENVNQIVQVLLKNYYEYNKDNSKFDDSFHEIKFIKNITRDNLYYIYLDYSKYNFKGYVEIFSIKSDSKYRALYNYLNTLDMFTKNLSDSVYESDFKEILSEKIIEIQLINSMTEWIIYSEL